MDANIIANELHRTQVSNLQISNSGRAVYRSMRQNFFTERVINPWNSLPPTVSFTSLSSFRQTICNVDFSSFVIISYL